MNRLVDGENEHGMEMRRSTLPLNYAALGAREPGQDAFLCRIAAESIARR